MIESYANHARPGRQVTDLCDNAADEAGGALLQAAQKDAIKALSEIQELRKAEREAARRMMAGANFASGRAGERGRGRAGSSKGLESKGAEAEEDTHERAMREVRLKEQQREAKAAPGKAGPGHRKQLSEKIVDEVIALEIQQDLLRLYTQAEVGGCERAGRCVLACENTAARFFGLCLTHISTYTRACICKKYRCRRS
jgi:hypothetical protein